MDTSNKNSTNVKFCCTRKEDAVQLLKLLDKMGYRWTSKNRLTEFDLYGYGWSVYVANVATKYVLLEKILPKTAGISIHNVNKRTDKLELYLTVTRAISGKKRSINETIS